MAPKAYVISMASQTKLSNIGKRSSIRNPKNPPKIHTNQRNGYLVEKIHGRTQKEKSITLERENIQDSDAPLASYLEADASQI